VKKIIIRRRASLRPMTFGEFAKAMKLPGSGERVIKLYLEYVYQHQKLDKHK